MLSTQARPNDDMMLLLTCPLTVILLAHGLVLRMDVQTIVVWGVHSPEINLGPGFDEGEHQFVPSAALIPRFEQ